MTHELTVGGRSYRIWRLDTVETGDVAGLPYSLKILLENLLRRVDGVTVTEASVAELAAWDPTRASHQELAFAPARILLQDFTGVPAVVDLAAMRDAVAALGGDAGRVTRSCPQSS